MMNYLPNILDSIMKRYAIELSTSEKTDSTLQSNYIRITKKFLSALIDDPESKDQFINENHVSKDLTQLVNFYKEGLNLIQQEIGKAIDSEPEFAINLQKVSDWCTEHSQTEEINKLADQLWKVFFPEGVNIFHNEKKSIDHLKNKRTVQIRKLNADPVNSPLDDVIFTSNVLLTNPSKNCDIKDQDFSPEVEKILAESLKENQRFWYDHPIQIGVEPDKNEVLYGMRALNEAVNFEKTTRNAPADKKLTCILSASVTHNKLHHVAKQYLEDEFHKGQELEHLDLYLFTEFGTDKIISEILVPAAEKYLANEPDQSKELLQVFGVDGEYGRHYSFLKAITALWQVFIEPKKKATFKIDLDQVFPQDNLVEESGASAFEHLSSPLWGAEGYDSENEAVDLGMIAGALVNEKDIYKSIFTADVPIPDKVNTVDELIFFSKLPQAISTQAEMMTRYSGSGPDGKQSCLQRVHVTGGTNGILIDRLFRYRPFTPSFFGRAEDQAYIMSILDRNDTDLAYVHASGLIMRHDKEAFAQEAMTAAEIGKLVGDYTRILLFSAYSDMLHAENFRIKKWLDPFTGCFISKIPGTVVYLRFALKAISFFEAGKVDEGIDFIINGSQRISETLKFIEHDFESQYRKERVGWDLYYDILEACKSALNAEDTFALNLKKRAEEIVRDTHLEI